MDWTSVVTHKLGLVAYALALVFGVIGFRSKAREKPWFLPCALILAGVVIVGGLTLAYLDTQEAVLPIAHPREVNQNSSGDMSPNINDVNGNVKFNYNTSPPTEE